MIGFFCNGGAPGLILETWTGFSCEQGDCASLLRRRGGLGGDRRWSCRCLALRAGLVLRAFALTARAGAEVVDGMAALAEAH